MLVDRKIAEGGANELELIFSGLEALKPVLTSLAVTDFSADGQEFRGLRHLELDLHQFTERDVSGNRGPHTALSKVFGAPMQRGLCLYNQPQIDGRPAKFPVGSSGP